MSPEQGRIHALLRLIELTADEELDCSQFLDRVAAYVEAQVQRRDLPPEMAAVAQHLLVCPECCEEFEAILDAYRQS